MTLYFIRHGETIWNAAHIYQGHAGVGLSEDGIKMVEDLRDRIKEKDLHFDKIYCSDLYRARQTCSILFPEDQDRVIFDSVLREINNTCLAGRKTVDMRAKYGQKAIDAGRYMSYEFFGGESNKSLIARAQKFLDRMALDTESDKVAVVTHGGVIGASIECIYNSDNVDIYRRSIPNASVTKLKYRPEFERWQLLCLGNKEEF